MISSPFDGIPEFTLSAQLESFTAAAIQLGVTSSAVGKSVTRLETRLGVKLLHRTTRKLTLTNEGEAYLGTCLSAMEALRGTEGLLATGQAEPRGRLKIDLPAAFGRRHIQPLLIKLARQYKALDLSVTLSEKKVAMVEESVDLAVRIGDLKDDPELVARRLGEQSLVICASPDYLRERPEVLDRKDLLKNDCIIGWRHGLRANWWLKEKNGTIVGQDIHVRHELADGESMLEATLSGCGLSQLPTWLVREHLQNGELVTVLDQYAGARMPIHVIWPRTRFIQPKVRIIVDELVAFAQSHPEIFLCGQ
ncbi:LysR family transcriptional regulator [Paraburkholderia nemoris]|uniref:LysR family transcriptional regulator n=1 Tax=Paraburkholderia nemoris TaxID=2793076 RepID=UPI0038BCE1F3